MGVLVLALLEGLAVASRELLAPGSQGAGAERSGGWWLEAQEAGKAGAELLEGGWLESQEAGKPGALLLEGGWLEDQQAGKPGALLLEGGCLEEQQERGLEDQLEVAGAHQLARWRDDIASRHGSTLQALGLRGASLAECRHSVVHQCSQGSHRLRLVLMPARISVRLQTHRDLLDERQLPHRFPIEPPAANQHHHPSRSNHPSMRANQHPSRSNHPSMRANQHPSRSNHPSMRANQHPNPPFSATCLALANHSTAGLLK